MTTDDRDLYTRLVTGDASAREEMILRYMPFVKGLAKRWAPFHLRDDAVSVGTLALVTAVDAMRPVVKPNPGGYVYQAVSRQISFFVNHPDHEMEGLPDEVELPRVTTPPFALDLPPYWDDADRELVQLRAQGWSDRQIAVYLDIPEMRVYYHRVQLHKDYLRHVA